MSEGRSLSRSYMDPTTDLRLISSDNVVFLIHSFYLKAHSSFFRDMLSNPSLKAETEGKRSPKPLPIDACARDLRIFLDYFHQNEPPPPSEYERLLSVLRLCDLFGCHIIIERITLRLPEYAEAAPWEIFCLASKLDQVNVAKDAIRHFGRLDFKPLPCYLPLVKAQQCRLPYLLGLFRAIADSSGKLFILERPQLVLRIDHFDVSERFQPVRQ